MRKSPLSQSQLGIYLGSAYREDQTYHIAYRFRFPAGYDTERLRDALKRVMAVHPALDVSIDADDKGDMCMILDEETIREIPVESMTEAEFEALGPEHIDIPGDGMCRFRIISTPDAVWLMMTVHHIVCDGSSMHVFMTDLDKALKGEALEPEKLSAFDLADRELACRASDLFAEEKEYYRKTFGDFDADGSELYSDAKGEEGFSHRAFRLATTPDGFKGSAMANAAVGIALGAFTGRDDVMFTTIYHGRNSRDTDNTVGMMVRTLPVRCHLGNDVTASELIREMKTQRDDTRKKDLFSFGDFVEMTGFRQNVLFGYQGKLLDMESCCSEMIPERLDAGDTGVPMTIQMMLADDGIDVDVIWRSDMYSERMVERFVETVDIALGQLCDPANADRRLSTFALLG